MPAPFALVSLCGLRESDSVHRFVLLLLLCLPCLATDRSVAEWVLDMRGRILVNDSREPISDLSDLPAGEIRLTGIDLYGTILDPKDISKLDGLTSLKELYLPGPSFNPGAGSKLDANDELKVLGSIKTLEKLHFSVHFLTNVNVQDKGLSFLTNLTNLKELRLAQGSIKKFDFSPFVNLESLDVSYSRADNDMMKGLASLKKLKRLNLKDTLVNDDGLQYIAGVQSLEVLNLYGLKITDKGLAYLKDLKNIRQLNLLGGPITDEGVEVLAGFPKLEELNLYRSEITNSGLARLKALKSLTNLDMRYSLVTHAGISDLQKSLPDCKIDFVGAVSLSSGKEIPAPKSNTPQAIAKWVQAVGGTAKIVDGKLLSISLATTPVSDNQIKNIAQATDLEELSLAGTEIGDIGLASLKSLVNLKSLELSATTVSDRGLESLAGMKRLENLSLEATLVRGPGLSQLKDLPALKTINLTSLPLRDETITSLPESLPYVENLSIAYSEPTNASMKDLARMTQLRSLDMTGTDVGDEGLVQLAKLTNLEELLLSYARFNDKGFAPLAALTKLRKFEAVHTRFGKESVPVLAKLTTLEDVNLDYTAIDDESIKALSALTNLRELRVDTGKITDASIPAFSTLKNLRYLNLYHTLITENGYNDLKKALPECEIVFDRDSLLPNRRGS